MHTKGFYRVSLLKQQQQHTKCLRGNMKNSVLFPLSASHLWTEMYLLSSLKDRAHQRTLTSPLSCTGIIIKPLPLPSPEMTSPPPFFSPRLSSTDLRITVVVFQLFTAHGGILWRGSRANQANPPSQRQKHDQTGFYSSAHPLIEVHHFFSDRSADINLNALAGHCHSCPPRLLCCMRTRLLLCSLSASGLFCSPSPLSEATNVYCQELFLKLHIYVDLLLWIS